MQDLQDTLSGVGEELKRATTEVVNGVQYAISEKGQSSLKEQLEKFMLENASFGNEFLSEFAGEEGNLFCP